MQRNAKEQEELAQEKKLLAEAIAELKRVEEEKWARYFSLCRWFVALQVNLFKSVSWRILVFN